jgi:hypothetical protein
MNQVQPYQPQQLPMSLNSKASSQHDNASVRSSTKSKIMDGFSVHSSSKSIISSLRSSPVKKQLMSMIKPAPMEDDEDVEASGHIPLMIQVFRNERLSPLSREEFQFYLNSQLCGELFNFFIQVEIQEKLAEAKSMEVFEVAEQIMNRFIRKGSYEEINISDLDRSNLCERYDLNPNQASYDPKLFALPKKEVINMLIGDKFEIFLRKQTETNMTKGEAWRRWTSAIVLAVLAVGCLAVLMWIQTFAEQPYNSRWWRLALTPVVFTSVGLFITSKRQVCTGLASHCIRMKEQSTFCESFTTVIGKSGTVVGDEMAKEKFKEIAQIIVKNTFKKTFMCMVLILLLPPGYGIIVDG